MPCASPGGVSGRILPWSLAQGYACAQMPDNGRVKKAPNRNIGLIRASERRGPGSGEHLVSDTGLYPAPNAHPMELFA